MALYINHEQHQGMYRNTDKLKESNQASFRRDHLSELLKEQQKYNDLLQKSIQKLSILNQQQDTRQSLQWQKMNDRLEDIETNSNQQRVQMVEHLKSLTDENKNIQKMLVSDRSSDQELMDQIKKYGVNNEELSQQITEQKEGQQEILKRLDNQEALTEKALRQISNLRSSLYERTNYLAETIEESYKLTSAYLYQLLIGADQPLTFYMRSEKNKDVEEADK